MLLRALERRHDHENERERSDGCAGRQTQHSGTSRTLSPLPHVTQLREFVQSHVPRERPLRQDAPSAATFSFLRAAAPKEKTC
jgi:hypothetical protein